MATVLILLDAFRWDYISEENTPFLYGLAQESIYIQKLKAGVGFCERTEILTGMRPDKSLNFTAIGYKPQTSFYQRYKTILKILSLFDKPKRTRRRFRWLLNHIFRHLGARLLTYEIPLKLLSYWDLTEDKIDHRTHGVFHSESIFDIMRSHDKDIFYDSFTALGMLPSRSDDDRIRMVLDNANLKYHLYLLFIGEADSIGHYYGPNSEETRQVVSRIDKKIRAFVTSFRSMNNDNVSFVLLGDHGMVDVDCYLNVWDEVKQFTSRYGFKEEKDYLMFLDSTLVRFWSFNDRATDLFQQMLCLPPFSHLGRIIDEKMADKYHIPYGDQEYGHIIWWANPGVVIYPDFFHSVRPVKGMHGYDSNCLDNQGFCIIAGDRIQSEFIKEGELIDICPTVCDLIEIPYPSGNQGSSFL